jgi:hypothetical protein
MRRRIFQWFTALLLVLCVWTAYANVMSDDTEVRAKARAAVNKAAGCGEDCKLEGFRGERGMITEEIAYDVLRRGHYVVQCRRAYLAFGDYECVVKEGLSTASATPPSGSGSPSSSPSSPAPSSNKP